MAETYTLHVAGLTRELTICKVNDHMDIAAFIMLGDAELTVAAAAELLKKCPDFDILLTAEAKGIPLAHEMSRQSGKPYVCARKGEKLYMADPVVVEDQSITTAGKQKLVIDRKELDKMSGKRVLVVDDVISTGGSLHALETLATKRTGTVVGCCAALAEGAAAHAVAACDGVARRSPVLYPHLRVLAEADEAQRVAGAGHGDIEQPPLLLDLGAGAGAEIRRQATVDAVQHIDPPPFPALGRMDGG